MTESFEQLRARLRVALRSRLEQVERAFGQAVRTGRGEHRRDAMARLHALKGEARLLGLTELAGLVHDLESRASDASALSSESAAFVAMRATLSEAELRSRATTPSEPCCPAELEATLQELARHTRAEADRAGKRVEVEVSAPSVALAPEQLDGLRSALLHLLDNAVDHGLELPRERGTKGDVGRIFVRVELASDKLRVLCEDDGRGIDLDAVRVAAVARGLVSAAAAQAASPDELGTLLFEPGVSTARAVTPTSGRGVGLDAARRCLRDLGGDVTLESEPGRGARFVLWLPLAAR